MAAIKAYFQVTTRSKKSWGHVGELVAYTMDTIDLMFADGKIRSFLHSEVVEFSTQPEVNIVC